MFCKTCTKKQSCKEVCPELNKHLSDQGIYAPEWIRPEVSKEKRQDGKGRYREVNFTALSSEQKKEFRKKYGDISEI